MGNVKFELNLKGLNELMKSSEMQSALDAAGDAVIDAAGEGYKKTSKTGRYMGFCNVMPDTEKARRDNLEHNTLLKAVGQTDLKMSK